MWIIGVFSLALGRLPHYFAWLVGLILTLIVLLESADKHRIFRGWAYSLYRPYPSPLAAAQYLNVMLYARQHIKKGQWSLSAVQVC
jgi:hypothetical protein